jgi:hypothetical protein
MRTEKGHSTLSDAKLAVAEAVGGFTESAEIIFTFASTAQDPDAVFQELEKRFPGVPIVGCTTAGEQLDGHHSNGGLVVLAASDTGITWAVETLEGLAELSADDVNHSVDGLFEAAGIDRDEIEPERSVCLLFIDGLRGAEERISALLADALEGVPLAGGSAGDDLKFAETRVFSPKGALTDAAVLVVAKSTNGSPIRILKHQHYKSTPKSVVVTSAEGRTVHEFDGYPALEGYARALGLAPEEVTGDVTFMNPVTFACNGELYVRSIHSIDESGSMNFYCAVEEGMVLDIGGHNDMGSSLRADLEAGLANTPELVVSFNCILRALEATGKELHDELGGILTDATESLVGFDTYGEQLNGLHINQTLVAACFGESN